MPVLPQAVTRVDLQELTQSVDAQGEMRTTSCRCQTALGLALRVRMSSSCVALDVVLGMHMSSRCFAALDVVLSTLMLPGFPWHQLCEVNEVTFWIASDCHVLIHPLHDFRMQC